MQRHLVTLWLWMSCVALCQAFTFQWVPGMIYQFEWIHTVDTSMSHQVHTSRSLGSIVEHVKLEWHLNFYLQLLEEIQIDSIQAARMALKVTNVRILKSDENEPFHPVPTSEFDAIREGFVQLTLITDPNGAMGDIRDMICVECNESAAIKNLRRGILSVLKTRILTDTNSLSAMTVDVTGEQETVYERESFLSDENIFVIRKKKSTSIPDPLPFSFDENELNVFSQVAPLQQEPHEAEYKFSMSLGHVTEITWQESVRQDFMENAASQKVALSGRVRWVNTELDRSPNTIQSVGVASEPLAWVLEDSFDDNANSFTQGVPVQDHLLLEQVEQFLNVTHELRPSQLALLVPQLQKRAWMMHNVAELLDYRADRVLSEQVKERVVDLVAAVAEPVSVRFVLVKASRFLLLRFMRHLIACPGVEIVNDLIEMLQSVNEELQNAILLSLGVLYRSCEKQGVSVPHVMTVLKQVLLSEKKPLTAMHALGNTAAAHEIVPLLVPFLSESFSVEIRLQSLQALRHCGNYRSSWSASDRVLLYRAALNPAITVKALPLLLQVGSLSQVERDVFIAMSRNTAVDAYVRGQITALLELQSSHKKSWWWWPSRQETEFQWGFDQSKELRWGNEKWGASLKVQLVDRFKNQNFVCQNDASLRAIANGKTFEVASISQTAHNLTQLVLGHPDETQIYVYYSVLGHIFSQCLDIYGHFCTPSNSISSNGELQEEPDWNKKSSLLSWHLPVFYFAVPVPLTVGILAHFNVVAGASIRLDSVIALHTTHSSHVTTATFTLTPGAVLEAAGSASLQVGPLFVGGTVTGHLLNTQVPLTAQLEKKGVTLDMSLKQRALGLVVRLGVDLFQFKTAPSDASMESLLTLPSFGKLLPVLLGVGQFLLKLFRHEAYVERKWQSPVVDRQLWRIFVSW